MNSALWKEVIASVQATEGSLPTPAGDRLRDEATIEDIQKLLELLHSDNAHLREVAVMPLIELAGPRVLPELFEAFQRDLDEGRSESRFSGALLHLPELFPAETRSVLLHLRTSGSESIRKSSDWLLEYCGGAGDDA